MVPVIMENQQLLAHLTADRPIVIITEFVRSRWVNQPIPAHLTADSLPLRQVRDTAGMEHAIRRRPSQTAQETAELLRRQAVQSRFAAMEFVSRKKQHLTLPALQTAH